jgi:hypothetical protein
LKAKGFSGPALKQIKRLQMSRFTNLIVVIMLMGMTLMPGANMTCFCPPECSGQQRAVPASCCTLPDPTAQSCCYDSEPLQPADSKTENRLLSWCMCDAQIKPAAISSVSVVSDKSFASAVCAISGASDDVCHSLPAAKDFLYKDLCFLSGRDILSTNCILLI